MAPEKGEGGRNRYNQWNQIKLSSSRYGALLKGEVMFRDNLVKGRVQRGNNQLLLRKRGEL
jgi:hypothetical protein